MDTSIPSNDTTLENEPSLLNNVQEPEKTAEESSDTAEPNISWEKRYKDTQKAYTKSRQELALLKAQHEALQEGLLAANTPIELSEEEQAELDKLKVVDPDEWRIRLNKYEAEAQKSRLNNVNKTGEIARRKVVLEDFVKRTGVVIDDDVVKQDIPPRITARLANGEVTFEQFLNECASYLQRNKKVKAVTQTMGQPNLNKVRGSSTPTTRTLAEDLATSYKKSIF